MTNKSFSDFASNRELRRKMLRNIDLTDINPELNITLSDVELVNMEEARKTIAILREGLNAMSIATYKKPDATKYIDDKVISLLNETGDFAVNNKCYIEKREEIIDAQYVLNWNVGETVKLDAKLNIDTFDIFDIELSRKNNSFEYLSSSTLEISHENELYSFEVESGKFTSQGAKDFRLFKQHILTKLLK